MHHSGLMTENDQLGVFVWIVIYSPKNVGKSKSAIFFLPKKITDLIAQGKELGEADDIVFGKANSKQKNGAVGLLTNNIIDRKKLYEDAIILALIPFNNEHLYAP